VAVAVELILLALPNLRCRLDQEDLVAAALVEKMLLQIL
jgi:hypothetical protein